MWPLWAWAAFPRAHIQAYLTFPERCRIVALVDIVPEKARKRAEEYGISCDILDDHHLLLDRRDIDLWTFAPRPMYMAEISVNCLRAGMNVLCEKPMAASLEECDQVLAAARESGKLFSSIAQNRFRTPIAASRPCWTAACRPVNISRWIPSGGGDTAITTCGGGAPGQRKAAAAP